MNITWLSTVLSQIGPLFVFLVVGLLVRKRFTAATGGIKKLILDIALPSIIFVAIMKVDFRADYLIYPVIILGVNGLLFLLFKWLMPFAKLGTVSERTFLLLLPSFAPGLSCFPYIYEFMNEESMAVAAFADVGNKLFVLPILYVASLWMYLQLHYKDSGSKLFDSVPLKKITRDLLGEPVTIIMVLALLLVTFGLDFSSLPQVLQESGSRLSLLVTPIVLIYIGLAVSFDRKVLGQVAMALLFRSGLIFILMGVLGYLLLFWIDPTIVFILSVFVQSSVSFWPFSHMAMVEKLEEDRAAKTFDLRIGLATLAISLPFNSMIVVMMTTIGPEYLSIATQLIIGVIVVFVISVLLWLKSTIRSSRELVLHQAS